MTVAVPTKAEVRAWAGVPSTTVDDTALQLVIDAELETQAALCRVDPYTAGLHQAALRRCARHLAAKGVPLGVTGDAELGAAQLTSWDAETERLERPLRLGVLA